VSTGPENSHPLARTKLSAYPDFRIRWQLEPRPSGGPATQIADRDSCAASHPHGRTSVGDLGHTV
jgi:hypothetical protein